MSSRMRMTLPVSLATSVPEPIAMPTSAWARGGASLVPSPTIATALPSPSRSPPSPALSCRAPPPHHPPLRPPHGASGGPLGRGGDGDEPRGPAVRGDEHHRLPLALQPLRL